MKRHNKETKKKKKKEKEKQHKKKKKKKNLGKKYTQSEKEQYLDCGGDLSPQLARSS